MSTADDEQLNAKLNLETGRIYWQELQRHFARGVVIKVEPGVDLVELAAQFHQDDASTVEKMIKQKKLNYASDQDAKTWHQDKTEFWAVVVSPWVLVQVI